MNLHGLEGKIESRENGSKGKNSDCLGCLCQELNLGNYYMIEMRKDNAGVKEEKTALSGMKLITCNPLQAIEQCELAESAKIYSASCSPEVPMKCLWLEDKGQFLTNQLLSVSQVFLTSSEELSISPEFFPASYREKNLSHKIHVSKQTLTTEDGESCTCFQSKGHPYPWCLLKTLVKCMTHHNVMAWVTQTTWYLMTTDFSCFQLTPLPLWHSWLTKIIPLRPLPVPHNKHINLWSWAMRDRLMTREPDPWEVLSKHWPWSFYVHLSGIIAQNFHHNLWLLPMETPRKWANSRKSGSNSD